MRILSVHKFWDDGKLRRLGASRSILFLYDEFIKKGHQVDYLFINDVFHRRPRRPHLTFPFAILPRILAFQCRQPYDVVDISSSDGWLYALVHRLLPRSAQPLFIGRTVGLEHVYWAYKTCAARQAGQPMSRKSQIVRAISLLKPVELSVRLSDHFLTICQADKGYIVQRRWKAAQSVSVISPGIPVSYFALSAGFHPRPYDCLFMGSWVSRKGIAVLAEAFADIVQKRPGTTLTVAGARVHGTTPEEILNTFAPQIRASVRVAPLLTTEAEIVEQYITHKIMLFPTLFEGFGMVFLEAMACGLPVVTTPIGGMADVIEDGITGVFVPLRDSRALAEAALELLASEQRRREIGALARERAWAFTWDRIADRCENLYQDLLTRRRT